MNYALAFVKGLHPADQLEATLGVQMAAIHLATMKAAENLAGAPSIEVMDMQERALNCLARTFAAQMEALKRYRSKGEQRVYVERVTVNEGGQAIVGPVSHGGGAGLRRKWRLTTCIWPLDAQPREASGEQCQAPAIKGKRVCRMHGGKSPGAPCGPDHGRYVHGRETREARKAAKQLRDLIRVARQLAASF